MPLVWYMEQKPATQGEPFQWISCGYKWVEEKRMTSEEFNKLVATARTRQDELLLKKGADYTRHDPDRLSNFKRAAKDIGITPLQAWAVYSNKHWDAVMAFIKTGKAESESITSRLDDLHNYLYLLEGLLT